MFCSPVFYKRAHTLAEVLAMIETAGPDKHVDELFCQGGDFGIMVRCIAITQFLYHGQEVHLFISDAVYVFLFLPGWFAAAFLPCYIVPEVSDRVHFRCLGFRRDDGMAREELCFKLQVFRVFFVLDAIGVEILFNDRFQALCVLCIDFLQHAVDSAYPCIALGKIIDFLADCFIAGQ